MVIKTILLSAINNKLNINHLRGNQILIQIMTTLTTPTLELYDKITSLNQPHTSQWITSQSE